VEGTAVLGGIAAVLRESDLNLIAAEHGRVVRAVAAQQQPETENGFIERPICSWRNCRAQQFSIAECPGVW
jgi:hypothetical protein